MRDLFEKYLPEIPSFVLRLPLRARAALMIAAAGAAALWVAIPGGKGGVLAALGRLGSTLPFDLAVAWVLGILSAVLLSRFGRSYLKQRLIYAFCRLWLEYREVLTLMIEKYDVHRLKDYDLASLQDILSHAGQYHSLRGRLRHLLYHIGEERLRVIPIKQWQDLVRENPHLLDYFLTPFSFLLNFRPPIYFIHNFGDQAWAALAISDEYIEYLTYKHGRLRSKLEAA